MSSQISRKRSQVSAPSVHFEVDKGAAADLGPARDAPEVSNDRHPLPPLKSNKNEDLNDLNGHMDPLVYKDDYDMDKVPEMVWAAKNLFMRGYEIDEVNHQSEDLWLETARLNPTETAKEVLARAVEHVPTSVRIWMKAANLETETKDKRRVFLKALEHIPNSVRLWKAAVEIENPEEATVLLYRAVESCPTAVELWIALAGLETYENAREVLNKARETIPTDIQLWAAAARLEEANGNLNMVETIIEQAKSSMISNGVKINRGDWFKEATKSEVAGHIHCCRAIITCIISYGLKVADRKCTWLSDAETFFSDDAFECARTVFNIALDAFPSDKWIWFRAAHMEQNHGSREYFEELLRRAVAHCPGSAILWLMGAKSTWVADDVTETRRILSQAFEAIPDSEEIWLTAVKLELENRKFETARRLLAKARESAPTPRVVMKSAKLEWRLNDLSRALQLLEGALEVFPGCPKLWMMIGQIREQQDDFGDAFDAYNTGVSQFPDSIPLWLLLSRLEGTRGMLAKARLVLERALLKNPKNEHLWLEAVRLEVRAGMKDVGDTMIAKALEECPRSGVLWAESIFMEPRHQRKLASLDALNKCGNDAHVSMAVGKIFWAENSISKCRIWFRRASRIKPSLGDSWAYWYRFEQLHGTKEQQEEVKRLCLYAEPRYGELWCSISKDVGNIGLNTEDALKAAAREVPIPRWILV